LIFNPPPPHLRKPFILLFQGWGPKPRWSECNSEFRWQIGCNVLWVNVKKFILNIFAFLGKKPDIILLVINFGPILGILNQADAAEKPEYPSYRRIS